MSLVGTRPLAEFMQQYEEFRNGYISICEDEE